MKRIVILFLSFAILLSIVASPVYALNSSTVQGWETDGGDYSGWSIGESYVTGNFETTNNNHRIWKSCFNDPNNFVLEVDIASTSNTTSPYLKFMGIILELDANNGNGNQVFIKINGQHKYWLSATGMHVHLKATRINSGNVIITLTGQDNQNISVYVEEPLETSQNLEIGMYRGGGIIVSNLQICNATSENVNDYVIDNSNVTPVDANTSFEFCVSGVWGNNNNWSSGKNETEGTWLQSSETDGVNAQAAYTREKLFGNWIVNCILKPISSNNGGRNVSRLEFLNDSRDSVMLLTLERLESTGQIKFTLQTSNGEVWSDVWKHSNWQDVDDTEFLVRMENLDNTRVRLTLSGNSEYEESVTADVPEQVMGQIKTASFRAESSTVRITNFTIDNPQDTVNYSVLASNTAENLLGNFLDTSNQRIYSVRWGFMNVTVTNTNQTVTITDAGEVWESVVMLMALDTYAQTLEKETSEYNRICRIIANTIEMLMDGYTEEQMTTAATAPNYAVDDCGWNMIGMLLGYHYNEELGNSDEAAKCLRYSKALFNSTYDTFYDEALGGGLWYNTEHTSKTSYSATVALTGYYLNLIQPDTQIRNRYMNVYNSIENNLRRPDGLYWIEITAAGNSSSIHPYSIREGGSCTYLGGNMCMAVLNALLGNTEKATQTALGITQFETHSNGALINDRDAWNNTFFLGMFVREVMPVIPDTLLVSRVLDATVSLILENSCFDDGYYSASWIGPKEPSSIGYPSVGDYSTEGRNTWGVQYNNNGLNIGSTPNQIMTSATTAHVLLAAALREALS